MNETDFYPEILRPHDPRFNPLPPPTQDVCEGPVFTVCVNVHWWAHLSGMIARLQYRDAWKGSEDEIDQAVESITKILNVGEPTMSCGCEDKPNRTRFTEDGKLEVSYDGGTTWVDGSDQDPRYTAPLMPRLPGEDSDEKRCDAAANVEFHFQSHAEQLQNDATFWATIQTIIAAFIGLLIFLAQLSLGTLTPIVLGIGAALLTVGKDGFAAAMTSEVWDTFNCIIYCHMTPSGSLESGGIDAVVNDINSQLTGIAALYLSRTVIFMGEVGINNMASTSSGIETTCLDCDCPVDGCEIDAWYSGIVANGGTFYPFEETSRGGNQIVVPSRNRGDGTQEVTITTKLADVCCGFHVTTVPEIDALSGYFYVPCGTTADYEHIRAMGITPTTTPMNTFQISYGSTPFVATFTFDVTP